MDLSTLSGFSYVGGKKQPKNNLNISPSEVKYLCMADDLNNISGYFQYLRQALIKHNQVQIVSEFPNVGTADIIYININRK